MLRGCSNPGNLSAKKFAESTGAKLIAVVVPNEVENGPEDYGINAKAAVTVIFAQNGKVKGNYSAAESKGLDAEKVVADIVSFLLKSNDMPAGKVELPADLEALKAIAMTEPPPGR